MSLCHMNWFSQTLQKQVGTYVILPDGGRPPFATFYLLHGLSDDYTIWLRRTRIETYAAGLPLIVVMPDAYRGFYTNNAAGPAYATYLAEELPAFIERNLPAKTGPLARCVGGLSMGGYGALRLALGYPGRYASANSHSGALCAGEATARDYAGALSRDEFRTIFGESPRGTDHDLVRLALNAQKSRRPPKLRIDCGTQDFLLEQNRKFHARLTEMGIPHEYQEFPGEHNWDYWDAQVPEALRFHARHLHLKPIA